MDAIRVSGGQCNGSGQGEEEEAMMTTAAMLSCKGRRWGDCDKDDSEDEVVEVDDNDKPLQALCGVGDGWGR